MIEPSVGRIVYYRPQGIADPTPHAAIVIAVQDERSVNLACFSPEGTYYHREQVPLLQDDDAAPEEGGYAEWMAYQKGQAAKTEAILAAPAPGLEPVHAKIAALETGVQDKFTELGDWLKTTFEGFEQRLAALAQTPAAPPQEEPAQTGDGGTEAAAAANNTAAAATA